MQRGEEGGLGALAAEGEAAAGDDPVQLAVVERGAVLAERVDRRLPPGRRPGRCRPGLTDDPRGRGGGRLDDRPHLDHVVDRRLPCRFRHVGLTGNRRRLAVAPIEVEERLQLDRLARPELGLLRELRLGQRRLQLAGAPREQIALDRKNPEALGQRGDNACLLGCRDVHNGGYASADPDRASMASFG